MRDKEKGFLTVFPQYYNIIRYLGAPDLLRTHQGVGLKNPTRDKVTCELHMAFLCKFKVLVLSQFSEYPTLIFCGCSTPKAMTK